MPVLEQYPGLLEALRGEMTPKFLATRSTSGTPNVVPVISILPADDRPDTLFFGNFLLRKSISNLNTDQRVAVLVFTPELRGWILRGDFLEFQRTGAYFDRQMGSSLLRYNAYTGIRSAGLIHVCAVEAEFAITKMQVLRDFVLARLAGLGQRASSGIEMPLPVQAEFAKMAAVKVLAWIRADGYPIAVPSLSLQPAGARALVCQKNERLGLPPPNAPVAANILTFDAISYQVKGDWQDGRITVREVYAGGPPLPGGRIA